MIDAPSPLKTLAQTAFLSLLCLSGVQPTLLGTESGEEAGNRNPILPGYYADPSIVSYEGKHYIYATIDPWGGETLSCWVSDDFSDWTLHQLNWPTKTACTSPSSKEAMVWAPSVVEGPDGRFYMHVSVGSEVWVGPLSDTEMRCASVLSVARIRMRTCGCSAWRIAFLIKLSKSR